MRNLVVIILLIIGIAPQNGYTQIDSITVGDPFFTVDERQIIETKWRYTYSLHLESNTILHQADEAYDYFLNFKFDYTYEQFLNGKMTKGTWSLSNNELFYSFKHIKKFEIAQINKTILILEFNQPNSKGTYQYHFVRVNSDAAPFIKPPNELPDVNVEAVNPKKNKRWWVFGKKKKKSRKNRRNKKRKRKHVPIDEEPMYISIELIGGGYYGGIDPVLRDYIHIKSNGRLIKEFKSVNSGLQVTKKDISRHELEQFAEYIIAQKFFDFERLYDCNSSMCQKRKHAKPTPIPLRLAVAYGARKKVVTISIWGKDQNRMRYVDYPPALDHIIDAIQRMAHRMDES